MYKTKLQELCHQKRWSLPTYSSMKDGPDHNPRFKSSVSVNGHCFHSSVSCKSSKASQNDAAELAFFHFNSPPSPPPPRNSVISSTEIAAGGSEIAEICEKPEIQSQTSVNKYDAQCRYKALLQNYAQRKNLDSPKFSSTKAGPAHAPCFKATVTIDGHTFDSLEFFKNLKQAEQAAAKVALMSLASDGFQEDDSLFYKTLLHELSQKEDLPVPLYQTIKCGEPHMPTFFSMVEVDGEVFYGKVGTSKKDAEMKAAKVAYTALLDRRGSRTTGSIAPSVKADETPNSTHSSEDIVAAVESQNLEQKCIVDSSPITELAEDSEAPLPDNAKVISSDDAAPSMDYLIGNKDTLHSSPEGGSSASPPVTELDVSALSLLDSNAGRDTETSSYLLCNRVRVYPCVPNIAFPKGITVMPISDSKWVAVSLEFPNEEAN